MKWGRKTNFEYRRRNQYPSVGCYLIDNYHTWYMGCLLCCCCSYFFLTHTHTHIHIYISGPLRTLPLNCLCDNDDDYYYFYCLSYIWCAITIIVIIITTLLSRWTHTGKISFCIISTSNGSNRCQYYKS